MLSVGDKAIYNVFVIWRYHDMTVTIRQISGSYYYAEDANGDIEWIPASAVRRA